MFSDWSNHTLKYQLNTIFLNITFWSLIVIGLSCIIFQQLFSQNMNSNIKYGFQDLSENSMVSIVKDGANFFDKKLERLTSNFPNLMTTSFEDSYRTDYPFGYIKSYYNYPNTFINEKYNSMYDANVSYKHSSYNIYMKYPNDIKNLQQNMQTLINVTSSTDYLFKPSFKYAGDFLAGYIATPSRFLRYYPASINYLKLDKYINYNNLNDYWYQEVSSNSETTYTSPYYDSIAKQLMITIGENVKNPYSGSIIGSFGSDLILTTIQNDIKKLIFLNKSRTIIFEKETGYVIADSFQTLQHLITYKNLTNPTFSNVWNKLIESNKELIELNGYYYVGVNLETSGNKYMIISTIKKSYITDQYSYITHDINSILNTNIYTIIAIFVSMLILISMLTYCLTNRIVTPIESLSEISKQMTNNIGERGLTENIRINIARTGVREIDEVTYHFNQSVTTIATPVENGETNVYYQNIPWAYNVKQIPSAPMCVVEYETKEQDL